MNIFDLSLASIDSRATCHVMMSEAFKDSCLDILSGKSVISRPTGSLTSLILYEYLPGVSPPRHTLSIILASILCTSSLYFILFRALLTPESSCGLTLMHLHAFQIGTHDLGYIRRKSRHNLELHQQYIDSLLDLIQTMIDQLPKL